MSRNGSGTYSLPAGNPVVTGTTISSTWANNTLSDIGTALTGSIAADGQTPITANLPMSNYKHTGVAVASALTDYTRADQSQNSAFQWLTVTGVDTIVASSSLTPAAYAAGQAFRFVSAGANTGAATININGLGAKAITRNGTTALSAGNIESGAVVHVVYDGTQFQLLNAASFATNATNATTAITQALTDSSTNIATTAFAYEMVNLGKNRIINGACLVDQRNAGASQTITAGAALAYTVDRFWAACTGANVSGQQLNAITGGYQFTGAASVTAIQFGQRIEAKNCYDLANGNASLSVELANSLLTSVTWTAYYANTADTFGTLASPTKTQIATGTFTVTSTLTRYTTTFAIPSAATTGIEIVFSVGAQTSGTWQIRNVQLESGSIPTIYERRGIGHELLLSQRYYEVIGFDYRCYAIASDSVYTTHSLIQKRITPTASPSGGASSNTASGLSFTYTTNNAVRVSWTVGGATAMTSYSGVTISYDAEMKA